MNFGEAVLLAIGETVIIAVITIGGGSLLKWLVCDIGRGIGDRIRDETNRKISGKRRK